MPSPPVPTTLMNDLRRLGLLRTAEDLNDILARATRLRWSPTVLLEHIVTAELEERQRRSIERRLTAARLGRFKPIADWDWNWPTALDRPALDRVLALDFLDRAENVILVGAQGLGKTMLAKNIVHQVVLAGHSARFITASDLLLDLNGQETARALERRLRHYARPALLAIDEIGYLAYDAHAADLLFQIVSRRYEHRPLLMTTNLAFKHWDTIFPNASCAVALIDRLTHHATPSVVRPADRVPVAHPRDDPVQQVGQGRGRQPQDLSRGLLRHHLAQGAEAPLQPVRDAGIGRSPGDLLLHAPVRGALDLLRGIPEREAQAEDGHILPPARLGRLVHDAAPPPTRRAAAAVLVRLDGQMEFRVPSQEPKIRDLQTLQT